MKLTWMFGLVFLSACVPGEFDGAPPLDPIQPIDPMVSPTPSVTPSPSPSPTASPAPEEPTFGDHWAPSDPTAEGEIDLVPVTPRDGRAPRRMSVAQLRVSIDRLFGGILWTTNGNQTANQMFTTLSRTLGEADYIAVTEENLDPNPIFAKFMDDMAGQICAAAVRADGTAAPGTQVVVLYPSDVPRNLRFLRLKLHSIHVPDGSTEGLTELSQLHANILADTRDADRAWTGVCIAMLTAPEFMAY